MYATDSGSNIPKSTSKNCAQSRRDSHLCSPRGKTKKDDPKLTVVFEEFLFPSQFFVQALIPSHLDNSSRDACPDVPDNDQSNREAGSIEWSDSLWLLVSTSHLHERVAEPTGARSTENANVSLPERSAAGPSSGKRRIANSANLHKDSSLLHSRFFNPEVIENVQDALQRVENFLHRCSRTQSTDRGTAAADPLAAAVSVASDKIATEKT